MKRTILSLMVLMLSLVSFAQKQVSFKVSDNVAYFKVTQPNKDNKYYKKKLVNGHLPSGFEKTAYSIFESQYNEVADEEKTVDMANITKVKVTDYYQAAPQPAKTKKVKPSANPEENNRIDYFTPVRIQGDAKDITAKAATDITSHSDLEVGRCYPLLKVTSAENSTLIDCPVICQVMFMRKSNILGSEGRLVIRPIAIQKPDGTTIRLEPNDIYRRGLNRTNVKFWLSEFVIPIFIPGTGAEIDEGETFDLRIQ